MKSLPDTNSPTWLGLPTTAETQLRIISGQKTLSKLMILQGLSDDITEQSNTLSGVNSLLHLDESIQRWLTVINEAFNTLVMSFDLSSLDSNTKAFDRCLHREISKGKFIKELVSQDLTTLRYTYIVLYLLFTT